MFVCMLHLYFLCVLRVTSMFVCMLHLYILFVFCELYTCTSVETSVSVRTTVVVLRE